tara:strand:- start:1900 stop:2550 length:651 start_codon:yes stop_codon:yes gene_type:complete
MPKKKCYTKTANDGHKYQGCATDKDKEKKKPEKKKVKKIKFIVKKKAEPDKKTKVKIKEKIKFKPSGYERKDGKVVKMAKPKKKEEKPKKKAVRTTNLDTEGARAKVALHHVGVKRSAVMGDDYDPKTGKGSQDGFTSLVYYKSGKKKGQVRHTQQSWEQGARQEEWFKKTTASTGKDYGLPSGYEGRYNQQHPDDNAIFRGQYGEGLHQSQYNYV